MPAPPSDPHPAPGALLILGLRWFPEDRAGLNRYMYDLLRALAVDRVTRAVVVGPAVGRPPHVFAAGTVDQSLPVRLVQFARAARRAAPGATLVDGHFALFTAAALTRRAIRALPLVVHFQGPWAAESEAGTTSGRLAVGAKRRVERFVYRRAERLVVLSAAFKRILVEDYGIAPWRISIIPPGVDLDRFVVGDRGAARRSLGLDPDAFIAVSARRLVPRTGVDVLIDAWARVGSHPGATLVIAGTGPEASALRQQAVRAGIESTVRFLGEVSEDDLVRLYQAADVAVVPSRALEGYGLVVLEALGCGTPTIGTDTGGLGEAVAMVDPDLVIPPDDADALAARLSRAIADPGSLPHRDRCRELAEAHGWPAVAAKHDALYAEAVSADPAGRLRVVYLDHTAQISGGEISLARLLPALGGVDTHVILATDGPLVTTLLRSGCSTEVVPLAPASRSLNRHAVALGRLPFRSAVGTIRHVVSLARHLRRIQPDLIHTCSLKAALYGGLAGRLAGVPVVWQINDRLSHDYLPRLAVRLVRAAARRIPRHVIANSEATAATLPSGVPITVIPPPIPSASPWPVRSDAGGLRVGIVGRLSPWKGQDVFLRAFARAFPTGDARALVIGAAQFGEDDIEPRLRALADELGLSDRVELLGHRDDIEEVMAGLDILVHASVIPEPFGMVIGEGLALGLPVVAADAGGPAEIIEHGVTGMLYPMGDADALAAVLRELAEDDDRRRRLGVAGRARAADFAPAVVASAVEAVYADVLSRPGR